MSENIMYKTIADKMKQANEEIDELKQEIKRLKKLLDCKERLTKIMPEGTEFIILTKADYERQEKDIELALIDYKSRCEKAVEIAKDLKQFVYDELVDRNVCGATETHDKIINLLNILNGDNNE